SKIKQQEFVTRFGLLLRFLVIGEPARFCAGERPGDKNRGRNGKKKKTVGFHVTIFDGNTARRKSGTSPPVRRGTYFLSPRIARRTSAGLSTGLGSTADASRRAWSSRTYSPGSYH